MNASCSACLAAASAMLGAAVAELVDEQAREAVEVALALGVVDVGALAAHDDGHLGLLVDGHPGEMHPQVVACRLLAARRGRLG